MRIISRDEWGAVYPRGFASAPLPATELWLHHSVTGAPPVTATFEQDVEAVRTLERIGQNRFGGGISYTFVVTPSGRVFEGHGVDRRGAHTGGRNSISRAICLIGNYDTATPGGPMLDSVAELVAHGHRSKWWPDRLTGGHRDAPGASTACPGRHAHTLIANINRRALAPQEDDMSQAQVDQLRRDIGYARDQILTALGVKSGAPAKLGDAELAKVAVARRVDVGLVRDLIEKLDVGGSDVSRAEFDALVRRVTALEARFTNGGSQ